MYVDIFYDHEFKGVFFSYLLDALIYYISPAPIIACIHSPETWKCGFRGSCFCVKVILMSHTFQFKEPRNPIFRVYKNCIY